MKTEDTEAWFGTAEQAIDTIFVICPATPPPQTGHTFHYSRHGKLYFWIFSGYTASILLFSNNDA